MPKQHANLSGAYRISLHASIHEIEIERWNALCGDTYPFLRHEFLAALEDSASVSAETGWQPQHLAVWHEDRLAASMPLYGKQDSYGEYVFDWAWADAYQRHGLAYYPKLVCAIPYSPVSGPRLVFADGVDSTYIAKVVIEKLKSLCDAGYSSWHLLFPTSEQSQALRIEGISERLGCQYHWFNRGYRDFDDFLAGFSARKRKNIKRERRRVREQGIELKTYNGRELNAGQLEQFYQFYQATYLKRARYPYLTQAFFEQLLSSLPDQVVLVMAAYQGRPIAAAFFLQGGDTLYGRYWGCFEEYDCLHFEACYYQGIEYCIRHGLARFDPGAQGEHKILRGFEPIPTYSLHWIAQPAFRNAIDVFLSKEKPQILAYIDEAKTLLPFRKDGGRKDGGGKDSCRKDNAKKDSS